MAPPASVVPVTHVRTEPAVIGGGASPRKPSVVMPRKSPSRSFEVACLGAVLQDFLPRYNARFAVQPEHPEPACRRADPDLCLAETLSLDNTVKYNWRVLQLLPGGPSPKLS